MTNKKRFLKGSIFWFGALMVAVLALIIFILISNEKRYSSNNSLTKLYYVDNISLAHQMLIDRFNQKYKNEIEVIPVNLPFSKFTTNERKEILARSLRSKSERIDVFAVDLIWGPRFARWGYPLDLYFDEQALSQINKYALESCYFENKLIALPLYIDIGLLYYRRDILMQMPDFENLEKKLKESITWTEFIQLGKKLKRKGLKNPFYIFAADSYEGFICSFHETLSLAESHSIFSSDSVNLNSPEARRGLQMLVDLINKFELTPAQVTGFDEYKSYVFALENDALFLRGWPGFHKHYRKVIADTAKINNFEVAALPHFKGNKKCAVYGGWNLMICKYSDKKRAALKFLRFVQEKENQELLFREGGYIPIIDAVYKDSVFLKENSQLQYYLKLLKLGRHRPFRIDYTKISDIMSHYLNLALKNEISVEQALIRASQKINSKQVFIK